MADIASDFLDAVQDMEDLRVDFMCGALSLEEAYDAGIVDEQGTMQVAQSIKTCRNCGATGLHWVQVANKWRLFYGATIHNCPVRPLNSMNHLSLSNVS